MAKTIVRTILIVLGLPRPVATLIVRMGAIIDALTTNKGTFPSPPIALALVSAHVAALSVAESATKTRTVGTIQTRDDARKQVVADAGLLHAYVQQLANASPDQAESIAADAAMTVRKSGTHRKSDLTVKQTVAATVKAVAANVKGARSHEWQVSTDGGKTWTSVPPTAQAHTTIGNLTPGTLVTIRQRAITKSGPGDWSAPVSAAVS